MGKATGFMEYKRVDRPALDPFLRTKNFEEFHEDLTEEERRIQGARCMNCGVPFCQSQFGCPLHNLIPEWNDEVYHGNWHHALDRLLKTNGFPEFTGRVCPAMCESACVCGLYGDKSISIRDNELAVIEYAYDHGLIEPKIPEVRTGKKVAVVGSGPAGLAAADLLNQRGHCVTILERDDRVGGLLMYGIPNMKLDKALIKRRVSRMEAEGVTFVTQTDAAEESERLLAEYDAVVLCCGARQAREIEVKGRNASGVLQAMEYLTESTRALLEQRKSMSSAEGKNVVIIGNGDTATDCVATAIRQGASSVTQLVRKPEITEKQVWPYRSHSPRPDYGQEEALAKFGRDPRLYETTAKELLTDESGALKGMVVVSAGEEKKIPAELLLIAAGFSGAETSVAEKFGLKLDRKNHLGGEDYRTQCEKVFAAGDMRQGSTLVASAIADGRACAKAVDEFLDGYSNL